MWWLWIVGIVVALACLKIWCIGGVNRYQPDLTGKVAVVVGGTAGIGKETARDLAKLGATVIITGRDVAKAAIVLESINSEMQVHVQAKVKPVEFVKSDCADLSQIKEFADQLARRYEAVDILVNNAGLTCSELTRTKQGIETTVGVNYISLVYLSGRTRGAGLHRGDLHAAQAVRRRGAYVPAQFALSPRRGGRACRAPAGGAELHLPAGEVEAQIADGTINIRLGPSGPRGRAFVYSRARPAALTVEAPRRCALP